MTIRASALVTITDGPNTIAGTATLDITPDNDASRDAHGDGGRQRTITQSELLANASDVEGASLVANSLVITAGSGSLGR